MNARKAFDQGMAAGLLIMLGADALRWFIATWTPAMSGARTALVALQLVAALGGAAWFILQRRRYAK